MAFLLNINGGARDERMDERMDDTALHSFIVLKHMWIMRSELPVDDAALEIEGTK
jgi:hypothetical protein